MNKDHKIIIDRHDKITFHEGPHIYTLANDDVKFTSVTTFIEQFHESFDGDAISTKISKGCEIKKAELLCQWAQSGPHGTLIHRFLELFAEGIKCDYTIAYEYPQFNKGVKMLAELKEQGWRTFKGEIIVWLKEEALCGTCDLLMINDANELLIADWKTCKDIPENAYGKKFLDPISHLDCSKHNKYALQMSLYQNMIEKVSDAKIVGRRLLHIPLIGDANHISCRYLKKEVEEILKCTMK